MRNFFDVCTAYRSFTEHRIPKYGSHSSTESKLKSSWQRTWGVFQLSVAIGRDKRSECEEKCKLIASERSVSIKFTPSSHSLRSFVGGKNRSHFGKLPQCICKSFSGMVAMEEKRVLTWFMSTPQLNIAFTWFEPDISCKASTKVSLYYHVANVKAEEMLFRVR